MIAWSDVAAIAPELASVPAGTQSAILSDVYTEVIVNNWPTSARADRAAKYLAAHMATLTVGARGAVGPLVSRRVGAVAEQFAPTTSTRSLESTGYGQEYLRQVRLAFGGAWVA